jgi:hypothetical protein
MRLTLKASHAGIGTVLSRPAFDSLSVQHGEAPILPNPYLGYNELSWTQRRRNLLSVKDAYSHKLSSPWQKGGHLAEARGTTG